MSTIGKTVLESLTELSENFFALRTAFLPLEDANGVIVDALFSVFMIPREICSYLRSERRKKNNTNSELGLNISQPKVEKECQ